MTGRATAYPPGGSAVRFPEPVLKAALEIIQDYGRRGGDGRHHGSEALVYIGGVAASDEQIVTSLFVLGHVPQGDRVVVNPAESRWLIRTLRARDEKLIGQIHSHRELAGHSLGDERHATSFHEGFLSIVVPRFGRGINTLAQCSIYEFRGGMFVELSGAEVGERVRVQDLVVRRFPLPAIEKGRVGFWRKFAKRLKSTGRRRR
jgi:hypothetical protein